MCLWCMGPYAYAVEFSLGRFYGQQFSVGTVCCLCDLHVLSASVSIAALIFCDAVVQLCCLHEPHSDIIC